MDRWSARLRLSEGLAQAHPTPPRRPRAS